MQTIHYHEETNQHGWTIRRSVIATEGNKFRAVRLTHTPANPEGRAEFSDCHLDGATLRWDSNNRLCPLDSIRDYHLDRIPGYDPAAQRDGIDAEDRASIEAYRRAMANHVPGPEEQAEMRAAFGPGRTVVNVITGRRTRT